MNSGPPGHGEGVTSSTIGFATLAIRGKFCILKAYPDHIWVGSRIPVNLLLRKRGGLVILTLLCVFGVIDKKGGDKLMIGYFLLKMCVLNVFQTCILLTSTNMFLLPTH